MVDTRSQSAKNSKSESGDMEYHHDCNNNESDLSIPERNSRGATSDIERANLLDIERDHERIRYAPRLTEINNRVREITSIVKILASQIDTAN